MNPVVRRLYQALLWVYPPAFRHRFRDEMLKTFTCAYDTQGNLVHRAVFLLRTVASTLGFALAEWLDLVRAPEGDDRRTSWHTKWSFQDTRYAARVLRRNPGFTLAAICTLALGIGANTAVFSVADGIMWKPFEYRDADQLVALWPNRSLSTREAVFIRANSQALSDVATVAGWTMTLTGIDRPTQVDAARVSSNLFELLGVPPVMGRGFLATDAVAGSVPVVTLSHGMWQNQFGSDPNVIGTYVTIDGSEHEVVGVMPPGFEILNPTVRFWTVLQEDTEHWTYRSRVSQVIGRTLPHVSTAAAQLDFQQLLAQMRGEFSFADTYGQDASVISLKERLVGGYRTMFFVLIAAAGFILVTAGSNLSTLFLIRFGARTREFALRGALGASRGRLMRMVTAESVLLATIGGLAGFASAYAGVEFIRALVPDDVPRIATVAVSWRALLACFGFTLLTGVFFALLPAWSATRLQLARAIGQAKGVAARAVSSWYARRTLVALQMALAVMLVTGAALMIQAVRRLSNVHPGFHAESILTLRTQPSGARYETPEQYRQFYVDIQERLLAIPGVTGVGAIQHLPLSGTEWGIPFEPADRRLAPGEQRPSAGWRIVTDGYFETLDIPLIAGRKFQTTDHASSADVALVNQTFADEVWPGESPLGKVLVLGRNGATQVTVIGVVGDVLHRSLDLDPVPEIYRPAQQSTMRAMMLAVRTEGPPGDFAGSVRSAVWDFDAGIPISGIQPLSTLVTNSFGARRLVMTLLGTFAVIAAILGAIGVYGVTASFVNQRRHELAIRMALGANQHSVRVNVLRSGVANAVSGTVIGLIGALLASHTLSSLLFNISTTDPRTFMAVALTMIVVAAAASYIPAWRATHIDPNTTLNSE